MRLKKYYTSREVAGLTSDLQLAEFIRTNGIEKQEEASA